MSQSRNNCYKCAFYSVSWDKKFPHACMQFNIKSARMPNESVRMHTGIPCPCFQLNQRIQDDTQNIQPEIQSVENNDTASETHTIDLYI